MNRLLEIGFQCVGHWRLDHEQPICELTGLMNHRNILYVFVVDGEVTYIGKTTQPLKSRMYEYQNPGPTQTTNIRNHHRIKQALLDGQTVDIFALPDNGLLHYGGFHINLAAGLEDSLISTLAPSWNRVGIAKTLAADDVPPHEEAVQAPLATMGLNNTASVDSPELSTSLTPPVYRFPLRTTYWSQGFFNVPVSHERYFGGDRESIEMYCGAQETPIVGYINRAANPNGTPRILGGASLKRWFQENLRIDELLEVEISSPTVIKLRRGTG